MKWLSIILALAFGCSAPVDSTESDKGFYDGDETDLSGHWESGRCAADFQVILWAARVTSASRGTTVSEAVEYHTAISCSDADGQLELDLFVTRSALGSSFTGVDVTGGGFHHSFVYADTWVGDDTLTFGGDVMGRFGGEAMTRTRAAAQPE